MNQKSSHSKRFSTKAIALLLTTTLLIPLSPRTASAASVNDLERAYKGECGKVTDEIQSGESTTNAATGSTDGFAAAAQGIPCTGAADQLDAAKKLRWTERAWITATALCTTSCVLQLAAPWGAAALGVVGPMCSLANVGASVTGMIMNMNLGKNSESAGMQIATQTTTVMGALVSVKDVASAVKDYHTGGTKKAGEARGDSQAVKDTQKTAQESASKAKDTQKAADAARADANANPNDAAKQQKASDLESQAKTDADKAKADQAEADKAESEDEDEGEYCMTAGMTALQLVMTIAQKQNAIKAGLDLVDNAKPLSAGPGQAHVLGSPIMDSSGGSSASASSTFAQPQEQTRFGNSSSATGGDICGSSGDASSSIRCATAYAGLPKDFMSPQREAALKQFVPGGLEEIAKQDYNSLDDAARGLAGLMPGSRPEQFGKLLSEADKIVQDKLGSADLSANSPTYTQTVSAPSKLNFGGEDKSMEEMMAMVNSMMNPKAGDEKLSAAKIDFSLHVKYMRDPTQVTEDRSISIFRRVTYRYNSVDEAQQLAINVPPRTVVAPVGAGQYPTQFQGTPGGGAERTPAQFR